MTDINSVQLELFKHRFAAIAEEMGVVLRRAAYSSNIKDRLDFSCAVFEATGEMVAQAAHIPVHLGAMPISVQTALQHISLNPGDVVLLNDPFQGGSHLPDITMISPVFVDGQADEAPRLLGFVANRAHHADVGGMSPGSMPVSREIYQEGLIIPPLKLVEAGQRNQAVWDLVLANVRTPQERAGDLQAQLAANQRGVARVLEVVSRYGEAETQRYMQALLDYAERMTRRLIAHLPDGCYRFSDFLDDDGQGQEDILIQVKITVQDDTATVDFSGSAGQVRGSVNAVYAVTVSAVYYVFRALIGLDIPSSSGCLRPLRIIAPVGSVVNAQPPAAVAGGNVEVSQRITDVLLGALAQAAPQRVPAASQGTMNNVIIGGWHPVREQPYTYYETIAGGLGAGDGRPGASASQCHMTNTLNTPVEALEYTFPFQVERYEIRRGSGGAGAFAGGDGVRREIKLLHQAELTLLTERRRRGPYGLAGGSAGQPGRNLLGRGGVWTSLPAKTQISLHADDHILIETPGGGGYGET